MSAAEKMADALRLIAKNDCENHTSGDCASHGRIRGAEFSADAWCDCCIANAALAAYDAEKVDAGDPVTKQDQRDALDRAQEMLRIAGEFCEDFAPGDTVIYDDAECDGTCIQMDCKSAAYALSQAFAGLKP